MPIQSTCSLAVFLVIFLIVDFTPHHLPASEDFSKEISGEKAEQIKSQVGNPEFYKKDLYVIKFSEANKSKWIESNDKKVSILEDYYYQTYPNYGNKKTLTLVSKLGFKLRNIPLDNIYFRNEAIATFLEGEMLLPLAKKWLKSKKYNASDLRGLDFRFPSDPKINKETGQTYFDIKESWTWIYYPEEGWRYKAIKTALGLQDYASSAVVTYGYRDKRSIIVHEYFHICGYIDHRHKVFDKGDKLSLYISTPV